MGANELQLKIYNRLDPLRYKNFKVHFFLSHLSQMKKTYIYNGLFSDISFPVFSLVGQKWNKSVPFLSHNLKICPTASGVYLVASIYPLCTYIVELGGGRGVVYLLLLVLTYRRRFFWRNTSHIWPIFRQSWWGLNFHLDNRYIIGIRQNNTVHHGTKQQVHSR
jgi:hypothetical protein